MIDVKSYARGTYVFGLRKNIEFDNIIRYIERLGHTVIFYTDAEAEELNKKHYSPSDGIDFKTSYAVTVKERNREKLTMYLHKIENKRARITPTYTTLHELGHIVLNHLKDICEINRKQYEAEAELFAKTIEEMAK